MLVHKQNNLSGQPASLPFPIISVQAMDPGVEQESLSLPHSLEILGAGGKDQWTKLRKTGRRRPPSKREWVQSSGAM